MIRIFSISIVAACVSLLAACDKKDEVQDEQGAAPPPIASTKPGACASGGGVVKDDVAKGFFPRTAGDYCIDPNGETRAYGADAKDTLEAVCTQLFDGECEVYKAYGLERVVTLRYVDGKGSPGSVNVNLSRFNDREGAYGFFTKRVIADADPLENAPKSLDAGAAGALGTGIAYVWRGNHVAELSYNNELETPDQLRASSQRVLPGLAQQIGKQLPGAGEPLPSVALLPEENRVPMGIHFDARDVLDVSGAGPGAVGYYKKGDQRWRTFAIVRSDEAGAKDVYETFKKLEGAKGIKGLGFDVLRVTIKNEEGPKLDWVIARRGAKVLGVGDEEYVAARDTTAPDEPNKSLLSADEKLAHVKQLIEASDSAPGADPKAAPGTAAPGTAAPGTAEGSGAKTAPSDAAASGKD